MGVALSRVVVVGAGITGLAAAWELVGAGVEVTVLDSERRVGGVIVTERRDGFLVEGGPDGWLASETEIAALAGALGIGDRVVAQQARGSSLWTGTALEPLEEGRAAALLGIEARGLDLAAGFRTFAAGMAEPVAALAGRLAGMMQFSQGLTALAPHAGAWRLAFTGGSAREADGIVLAIPAYAAGRLLEQAGVEHARDLGAVVYLPSITVSLAYRADQLARPLDGTGFVAAPDAGGVVRACTYASVKYAGRAPEGHVLLRAFLAPADGDAAATAHAGVAAILGIRGAPLWARAFHWSRGLPRYRAGGEHAARVAAVRDRLARLPPLAIAGAGYDGAGVSACVRSGRAAGRLIAQRMSG